MPVKRNTKPKPSAKEAARLQALAQFNLFDTSRADQFDDLTRLAAQICKTPIAFIGVVDKDRVWFKSKSGLTLKETPRPGAFCGETILQTSPLVVADALQHNRFKKSSLVIAKPHARFYAGVPMITSDGHAAGTLAVMDCIPRELSEEQLDALSALARQVMVLIESQPVRPSLPELLNELTEELDGRSRAHEMQTQREARLKAIVNYNITGISFANLEGTITEANDTFFRITGQSRDDLLTGRLSWRELTPKENRDREDNAVEQMKMSGASLPYETEYVRKDGSRVPVLFGAALVPGLSQQIVCFSLDLTDYKQARDKANYFAYHDPLTNLPNEALFKDRVNQALALARRNEQMIAIMLVNLDRLKTIRDTLGYVVADRLLLQVRDRLAACVRESDTVARLGSEELALLLTHITRAEDAAKIAQSINEALSAPFDVDDQELFVATSIGISLSPDDAIEPMTLLKCAGTALNRAKEQVGSNYEFYTSGRTTKALKQLVLENNLRPALDREEFIVHYQPQVDIETFQIVGVEALVRWHHPGLGLLQPAEFIHLAEESGLIISIGEWILRAACMQSKSWQDTGFEPFRVSVNLSARQFQQPELVQNITRIIKDVGLDPRYLELELTEVSVMKDPDQAARKLHELKAMGVRISIDDFGTGYSSLNYLKRFPIDTLKIDRSFVSDITTDSDDAAIVNAIITLAHALKLNVIAEGVETQEQLEFLSGLECDEVQGFLFSKPLSADEFTELLMERSGLSSRPSYDTNPLPPLHEILSGKHDKTGSTRERKSLTSE